MTPFVSIICPTYNEEKYIVKCIESIIQQDYPVENIELLFVDGRSTDKTREIILEYQEKYRFIKLLDNPYKVVPYAMNTGIKNSMGNIIIRIDAHAFYPSDYIGILSEQLVKLNVENVGVCWITDVLNKTPKTLAIKEVLSHPFGVGNSMFRLGTDKIIEVDTVPFGCYRKEVFEKYGLYNEKLVRNQDIELNKRIKRGGGKILLIPDTYCIYYARETFNALMKNNYQNGKWNLLTVYYTKMFDSLSIRHFVPLIFILSLVVPLIFSVFYCHLALLSGLSALLYLGLICFLCVQISLSKRRSFFYLLASFVLLHFSYGIGSLAGLFKMVFVKKWLSLFLRRYKKSQEFSVFSEQ